MADVLEGATVQEKFLVMLLERVQKLEDELKEKNDNMKRLLSHTTSTYFKVNLSGVYNSATNDYADLTTVMDDIIKTIHEAVPCTHIYALYSERHTRCNLLIHTQNTWLLKSIIGMLDERLRRYVNLNTWVLVHEWNLDLKHYKVLV